MLKYDFADVIDFVERSSSGEERQRIYLDFQDVKLLDSALLGKLIILNQKIQFKKWQIHLINIGKDIQEVFGITKLDKLFGF